MLVVKLLKFSSSPMWSQLMGFQGHEFLSSSSAVQIYFCFCEKYNLLTFSAFVPEIVWGLHNPSSCAALGNFLYGPHQKPAPTVSILDFNQGELNI